jgi:hypothetical protein
VRPGASIPNISRRLVLLNQPAAAAALGSSSSRLVQRGLASSSKGPEGAESHDDFKPQRKAPPADLDGAVQMIEEQVRGVYLCVCVLGLCMLCFWGWSNRG